ncbi:helix-turn-helix domain-containing protein [Streptomyces sp. B-S-A6]|uniref:Helix-turn-helix domain-containing protein n=1 Tax=Streptomyces cavernicola TaxID=3043613 RepID=A0ABT6SCY2_9ACTN|nr:helix-turn-helix domain-containing protein [Streptomyces sp. B-S-A6]MDI3405824.1 helix-turn-helix domain-containing protein [Streptomyces sp. B-S-A6]
MSDKNPGAGGDSTLAARLDHLFEVIRPAGRTRPYSNDEVAALLQEQGGPTVSGTYLWQLRTGRRDNPTKRHLEALADFFGVPVAYFFDADVARRVGSDLETLLRLREAGVQSVALRAVGLSPKSMDAVLAMIDRVRELEGLPPGPGPGPEPGPAQ